MKQGGRHSRTRDLSETAAPSHIRGLERGDAAASIRNSFIRWAHQAQVPLLSLRPGQLTNDLSAVGRMIGDASIVLLGEAEHLAAEPLEFRNRLFQYLVNEKGFTAIAIESGIVEGRLIHDYVRGGQAELSTALLNGISWTFDRLPQNHALVQWLREHNSSPNCVRKVNFYGFDAPGSPGNPHANRGVDTALREVLHYLEKVDLSAFTALRHTLDHLLPRLRFDVFNGTEGTGYQALSQSERDALSAAIADSIALLERCEACYSSRTSNDDYQWAYRAALGARQVDGWLRQVPMSADAAREPLAFLNGAPDLRDRAQADNLDWIIEREGVAGKILIFAHNNHLSGTPTRFRHWLLDAHDPLRKVDVGSSRHEVAGTYLRRRHPDRLLIIGNLIGARRRESNTGDAALQIVAPNSMDEVAAMVGVPRYLLDLRRVPSEMIGWLAEERQIGCGFNYCGKYWISIEVAVAKAFDVLVYFDTIRPAGAPTSGK